MVIIWLMMVNNNLVGGWPTPPKQFINGISDETGTNPITRVRYATNPICGMILQVGDKTTYDIWQGIFGLFPKAFTWIQNNR